MSDEIIPVASSFAGSSMNAERYKTQYARSLAEPDAFWREELGRLDWIKRPEKMSDVSFHKDDFRIRWFEDGILNVSVNCIDRHLAVRPNKPALIWEGTTPPTIIPSPTGSCMIMCAALPTCSKCSG